MSSEEGTRLRRGKIMYTSAISGSITISNTESAAESNVNFQIAEIKDSCERKFKELQSEVGELKNLMTPKMEKSSNANATTSGQGSSKQP